MRLSGQGPGMDHDRLQPNCAPGSTDRLSLRTVGDESPRVRSVERILSTPPGAVLAFWAMSSSMGLLLLT